MGALRCNQELIKNNLLVCILTFLLYINHDRRERRRYQPQTICFIIAKTWAEAKEDRELSLPDLINEMRFLREKVRSSNWNRPVGYNLFLSNPL